MRVNEGYVFGCVELRMPIKCLRGDAGKQI